MLSSPTTPLWNFWSATKGDFRDVLRAQRILPGSPGKPGVSMGEVRSHYLGFDPHNNQWPMGSLLGSDFLGPEKGFSCYCGHLSRAEDENKRCDHCHTLCLAAKGREQRWLHYKTTAGLLHPLAVPMLAQLLGWSEKEVWAVGRFQAYVDRDIVYIAPPELLQPDNHYRLYQWLIPYADKTGPGHIRTLLRQIPEEDWPEELWKEGFRPHDLTVDILPVLPLSHRPMRVSDSGHTQPGQETMSYLLWSESNQSLQSIFEYSTSTLYQLQYYQMCQFQFEELWKRLTGHALQPGMSPLEQDDETLIPEGQPSLHWLRDTYAPYGTPPAPQIPRAIHPVDEERVALLYPHCIALLNLSMQLVEKWLPISMYAHFQHGHGPRMAFLSEGYKPHRLNLATEEWESGFCEDFHHTYAYEAMEQAMLYNPEKKQGWKLREVADYPIFQVFSPAGKYCWSEDKEGSGGIYASRNGLLQFSSSSTCYGDFEEDEETTPPVLEADGRQSTEYEADKLYFENPPAFCLSENKHWHLLSGPYILCNDSVVALLAEQWLCAQWEPGGKRLWLANAEELQQIEVQPTLRVLQRWSLKSLHSNLQLPSIFGVTKTQKCRLLGTFGTVEKMLEAGKSKWLDVMSVGKKTVERLEQATYPATSSELFPLPVVTED